MPHRNEAVVREQRHIIRRQVLELHTHERTARQLQEEMHRVFRSRIVPEIDRCCSELSSPDRIDRIDSLVVDIGRIDPDNLEAELTAKVIPRLRAALAEQIGQQNAPTAGRADDKKGACTARGTARSQLELFAFFARTGTLPWWADSTNRDILSTCLGNLLEDSPGPLCQLLRQLATDQRTLERLVLQFSAEQLHALAVLAAPALQSSVAAAPVLIKALLQSAHPVSAKPPPFIRQRLWTNLLREAALAGKTTNDPIVLYRPVLRRLATECGISSATLLETLSTGLEKAQADTESAAVKTELLRLLRTLQQEEQLRATPSTTSDEMKEKRDSHEMQHPSELAVGLGTLDTECGISSAALLEALSTGLEKAQADTGPTAIKTALRKLLRTLQREEQLRATPGNVPGGRTEQIPSEEMENSSGKSAERGPPDTPAALAEILLDLLPRLSAPGQAKISPLLRQLRDQADKKAPEARRAIVAKEIYKLLQGELIPMLRHINHETETGGAENAGDLSVATGQEILRLLRLVCADFPPPDLEHDLARGVSKALPTLTSVALLAPAEAAELRRIVQSNQSTADALPDGHHSTEEAEGDESPLDLSFSAGEEIYIDNAGLVILWPFIQHYVQNLDLLDPLKKNAFRDEPARHRAAGLLQHLVDGEARFPEYLLPLNKVLCSMDLHRVFDFGEPLREAEQTESDNLLRAVIAQASILRDMSIPALRSTFLLRRGKLSSRDGAWLLQVERETYDVVLDRFPWGWEWVKLPWMETPLRVEW